MPLSSVTQILGSAGEYASLLAELEKLRRNITVMFTDIRGSTSYFERYGDAAGLFMVNECNRTILESVRNHEGTVIKTIGDGVMATFPEPRLAVVAAIAIQKDRYQRNLPKPEEERTYVRIGINYGLGIVKSNDVLNVASRVENFAQPEQIVISLPVREQISGGNFSTRPLGHSALKG